MPTTIVAPKKKGRPGPEDAREHIRQWAGALSDHPQLRCDLAICHDYWTRVCANGSGQDRVHARFAIQDALWGCYENVWKKAPGVAYADLDRALIRAAVANSWQLAIDELINVDLARKTPVHVAVYDGLAAVQPPWQPDPAFVWGGLTSDQFAQLPASVGVLLVIPRAAASAGAKEAAHAALEKHWDDRVAPYLFPDPGKRTRGGRRGGIDYARHMLVYQVFWGWKRAGNRTWATRRAFGRLKAEFKLALQQEDSGRYPDIDWATVKKAWPDLPTNLDLVDNALGWLEPICPLSL